MGFHRLISDHLKWSFFHFSPNNRRKKKRENRKSDQADCAPNSINETIVTRAFAAGSSHDNFEWSSWKKILSNSNSLDFPVENASQLPDASHELVWHSPPMAFGQLALAPENSNRILFVAPTPSYSLACFPSFLLSKIFPPLLISI